jgi:membrane protease YdiL (CAAX protease family)
MSGPRQRSHSLQFALFLASILWYLCARMLSDSAANGIARRFDLGDFQPLLTALLLLFLIVCGFALLRAIERRRAPLRLTLGLPRRSTSRTEWAIGAAIGWGLAVAAIVPMTVAGSMRVQLWTAPRAFWVMGLSLLTLAIATLAHTMGVFGYGFQRLIEATGPVRATLVIMALAALHTALIPTPLGTPDGTRILVAMLSAILLCLCWFRTHGLWLGWGLHFAWAASTGVLFGLPLGGDLTFSSVVDTRTVGAAWLTGGGYGPTGAAISILLVLAAIPIVMSVTSDYAWNYTHAPIIPGGYDVTIPPPAAHMAMEEAALASQPVNPASLVQILPATPRNPTAGGPPK